ncbi:MAG: response regulator [Nitrospirales bacterium]
MNQRSSSFMRTPSQTHAMTSKSQNDPRGHSQDDSAVSTLQHAILVVEDDPSVSQMLLDALEAWGYEVVLAKNGREGLQVLTTQVVGGILLDMNMPVMSGKTMLDELRWLGNQTPVVVMSGGLDISTLRQFVKEGAQAFAVKPFSLSSLRKICARVFERPTNDVP